MNALSQALLKLTAPGIPDTYQGTELWDLSLVDPDNRRPVDYELRRRLLKELPNLSAEEIWRRSEEGLPKLWVTWQALQVRRDMPETFGPEGDYEALPAKGEKGEHALAFERGKKVVVIVTRLPVGLGANWGETGINLSAGRWRNVLNGSVCEGNARLNDCLTPFPIALMVKE